MRPMCECACLSRGSDTIKSVCLWRLAHSHVIPTASCTRKCSAITGMQPAATVSLHNPLFGGILLVKVL